MRGKTTISIRFCGGCNPRINRGRIAAQLQNDLTHAGFLVVFNQADSDFILYISGCQANCAERYHPTNLPHAAIAGAAIAAVAVAEHELSSQLIKKVRDHFERLENPVSS